MEYQYKVGDKVRIKEREGRIGDYPFDFCESMSSLAGTICEIKNIILTEHFTHPQSQYINGDYHMYRIRPINPSDHRDFVWAWHSSMFEPVLEDFELQTSTSVKEGDLLPICGMVGKIQHHNDREYYGYYLGFDGIGNLQEHCACCAKLKELVPNFDKIVDSYYPTQYELGYFPEFSTINDLMKFVQAVNNAYNSKKSIITPKILNKNEIKFQKSKASYVRGSVPKGNPICGRKHKTAIVVGCLSNQEISC